VNITSRDDALAALSSSASISWKSAAEQAAKAKLLTQSTIDAISIVGFTKDSRLRFSVALSIAVAAANIVNAAGTTQEDVIEADRDLSARFGVTLHDLKSPDSTSLKRVSTAAMKQHAAALRAYAHCPPTGSLCVGLGGS
jgi:hypothetical protein